MKRSAMIIIFLFVVSMVHSASINCYIPRKGDIFFYGQTYTITWVKEGDMEDRVRILLFGESLRENSSRMLSIHSENSMIVAEEALNDSYQNFFRWRVSERIPEGEYKIRIMTLDERVISEGRLFSIKNPEREAGHPDLVFTGKFFLGNRYVNIAKGNSVVITPSDLNASHRNMIGYDSRGNAISAIIPFDVILKNIGDAPTGSSEVIVKHLSGPYTINHQELKPGEAGYENRSYMQMGIDLTKGRAFEIVLLIDPDEKILNEERGNNKFFFVLELKNF